MPYIYDYPRPCVTCDTVVLDVTDVVPMVLLILRKNEPFKGLWALPGGFLNEDEELEECAARELAEETGLDIDPRILYQICTIGRKNRDPRGRIISIVYCVSIDSKLNKISASDDAEKVQWFKMDELPSLAADHLEIIRRALGENFYDRC